MFLTLTLMILSFMKFGIVLQPNILNIKNSLLMNVIFFCSRVFPDREKMIESAIELAALMASKSPVAVQGTKVNLVYSRDNSVPEGLHYMVYDYR